jgi:hypothetical protein
MISHWLIPGDNRPFISERLIPLKESRAFKKFLI